MIPDKAWGRGPPLHTGAGKRGEDLFADAGEKEKSMPSIQGDRSTWPEYWGKTKENRGGVKKATHTLATECRGGHGRRKGNFFVRRGKKGS